MISITVMKQVRSLEHRAAQSLLDHDQNPETVLEELRCELAQAYTGQNGRPEEQAMRVARGCRNAALQALAFENSLSLLSQIQAGEIARLATDTTAESTARTARESFGMHTEDGGFEPRDVHFLGAFFQATNQCFDDTVRETTRQDLVDVWLTYDDEAGRRSEELLSTLSDTPQRELSSWDGHVLDWLTKGVPHTISAAERARKTNTTTTTIILNLLIAMQRRNSNQCTGQELAKVFLKELDAAVALSGGRREVVTTALGALICPHLTTSPVTIDAHGRYDLGPFRIKKHMTVPGTCVAYPLLHPGTRDPQKGRKKAQIVAHRENTNGGNFTPSYPHHSLRASEASLVAAAVMVGALWKDTVPFLATQPRHSS